MIKEKSETMKAAVSVKKQIKTKEKINKVIKNYKTLKDQVLQYKTTNDFVVNEYYRIITKAHENKC